MNTCPKCGGVKFKRWGELNQEQRFIVQRLPASAEIPFSDRKEHSTWCMRCFYEIVPKFDRDSNGDFVSFISS